MTKQITTYFSLNSNLNKDIISVLIFMPSWIFYPEIRDNDKGEVKKFLKAYKNIIKSICNTVEINIVTHKVAKPKIEELVLECKRNVKPIYVNNSIEFSIWSQDVFCIATSSKGDKYIMQPNQFNRQSDDLLPQIISTKCSYKLKKLNLFFQGGNIIVGDNFWLVGGNDVMSIDSSKNKNLNKTIIYQYKENLDFFKELIPIYSTKKIQAESTKKILINGDIWTEIKNYGNNLNSVQPIFHIDMFITLLGRTDSGTFKVLVGDSNMSNFGLSSKLITPHLNEIFDDIAEFLKNKKFEVVRNPLPYIKFDDKKNKIRKWYYATYNNVFMNQNTKTVILPTYHCKDYEHLKSIDEYNIGLWKEMGFNVKKINNFHKFTKNYGAINCIIKNIN
jgi:agmatine/peptidylarginine deiminase